jgi:hypothetical protein
MIVDRKHTRLFLLIIAECYPRQFIKHQLKSLNKMNIISIMSHAISKLVIDIRIIMKYHQHIGMFICEDNEYNKNRAIYRKLQI